MATATGNEQNIANLDMPTKRRSLWADAMYRLFRNKGAIVGMVIISFFILVAIFASVIFPPTVNGVKNPHAPLSINDGKGFLPPAWTAVGPNGQKSDPSFVLGTDTLGRDVLSRVVYGARVSMVVGFIPTFIMVVVGLIVGLYSGYQGGWIDNLLMRLTDIIWAFPDILFFIIVMIALRDTPLGQAFNGLLMLFGALALVNWVGEARVVRGQVLSLKEKEFVEAARCIGATDTRIMFKHILPNSLGPVIIMTAMAVPGMIITEAILGFLGLGLIPAQDPNSFFITSWGALMLEGQTALNAQPWLLFGAATCVALVVLSFNFLGDGLRDAFDPRMQGVA